MKNLKYNIKNKFLHYYFGWLISILLLVFIIYLFFIKFFSLSYISAATGYGLPTALVTLLIGLTALYIQNENKKISEKKLLLDTYKELDATKKTIGIALEPFINAINLYKGRNKLNEQFMEESVKQQQKAPYELLSTIKNINIPKDSIEQLLFLSRIQSFKGFNELHTSFTILNNMQKTINNIVDVSTLINSDFFANYNKHFEETYEISVQIFIEKYINELEKIKSFTQLPNYEWNL